MIDGKGLLNRLEKFKYPLLILVIGLALMLIPGTSAKTAEQDPGTLLQDALSRTQGVGEARVLISESGVIVVCRGAENPQVRLDIIHAVTSYTGFGSDKITILKMSDQS